MTRTLHDNNDDAQPGRAEWAVDSGRIGSPTRGTLPPVGIESRVGGRGPAGVRRLSAFGSPAVFARIRHVDPADPLLVQVLPQAAETAAIAGFATDPLGEADAPGGCGLLRKYQGRTLMVASGTCCVHCRFCFRRHFPYPRALEGGKKGVTRISHHMGKTNDSVPLLRRSSAGCNSLPQHCLEQAVAHSGEKCGVNDSLSAIAADRSIHEVILSGGDPLMLPDDDLAKLIQELSEIPIFGGCESTPASR